MKRRLISALSAALPTPVLDANQPDAKSKFTAYVENIKKLETCQDEVQQLLRVMCARSVTYELAEQLQNEVRQQMELEVAQDFSISLTRPINAATAELAAKPLDAIRQQLNAAMQESVKTTIDQLITGLDGLVDKKVVGLVHWTGQNTVRYDFYKRIVHGRDYRVSESFRDEQTDVDTWTGWKRVQTRHEIISVSCTIRRHKHEAIDAFQTSLDNTRVVMPPDVVAICEAIPTWLRSEMVVLDGYLIHQPVFDEVVYQGKVERRTETDIPMYGLEPGVICGFYVLTGWGPSEIAAECKRRKMQVAACIEPLWPICALTLQLFSSLFSLCGMTRFALVTFMGSGICLAKFIQQFHHRHGDQLPLWQSVCFFTSMAMALAGFHLILGASENRTTWVGLVLALGCLVTLWLQRDYPIQMVKFLRKGTKS